MNFMSRSGLEQSTINDLEANPKEFSQRVKFPNKYVMELNITILGDQYMTQGTLFSHDNKLCGCTEARVNTFRGEYRILYNDSEYLVKV